MPINTLYIPISHKGGLYTMSYLFHHNKRFALVDSSAKMGVYCQFFTSHPSKIIPIVHSNVRSYSCCCLSLEEIYVVTLSESGHIHLHSFEGSHFSKPQLIASASSNYSIDAPLLYSIDHTLYITYVSHQSDTTSYSFIQQNLRSSQMTTLCILEDAPTHIKLFTPSQNVSYIFFVTHDSYYHLNALMIASTDVKLYRYMTSPSPIIDYSICACDQLIHITYVTELHGKFQLCYFNPTMSKVTAITTTLSPCKPVIFCYYHTLWINLYLDQSLDILLSIDHGLTFSQPVTSSLQSNVKRATFYTTASDQLTAQEIYFSLGNTLKLCTIAMIDFYTLHYDSHISPELELLLEGLSYNRHCKAQSPDTSATHNISINSDPPMEKKTSPSNIPLDEAKKAFMEELSGWDLPPRI